MTFSSERQRISERTNEILCSFECFSKLCFAPEIQEYFENENFLLCKSLSNALIIAVVKNDIIEFCRFEF